MPGDDNKEYTFTLDSKPELDPDVYEVRVVVTAGDDTASPTVSLIGNASVPDMERIMASALEALDNWWAVEAKGAGIDPAQRDPAFQNQVWTPFWERDPDA